MRLIIISIFLAFTFLVEAQNEFILTNNSKFEGFLQKETKDSIQFLSDGVEAAVPKSRIKSMGKLYRNYRFKNSDIKRFFHIELLKNDSIYTVYLDGRKRTFHKDQFSFLNGSDPDENFSYYYLGLTTFRPTFINLVLGGLREGKNGFGLTIGLDFDSGINFMGEYLFSLSNKKHFYAHVGLNVGRFSDPSNEYFFAGPSLNLGLAFFYAKLTVGYASGRINNSENENQMVFLPSIGIALRFNKSK